MVIGLKPEDGDDEPEADNIPGATAAAIPDIMKLLLFIGVNPIFI